MKKLFAAGDAGVSVKALEKGVNADLDNFVFCFGPEQVCYLGESYQSFIFFPGRILI